MRGWRSFSFFFSATLLAAILVAACGKGKALNGLKPQDFAAVEDGGAGKFDPNNVLDPASFEDIESKHALDVQNFFHRGPYDQSSFLETYQSNGIRASDAIQQSALTYRINPLVFLVFSEMYQGLVGNLDYPFPPSRVEYVFRCGCFDRDNCLANMAGFDRQVDCLGRNLRQALDQVTNSTAQKTASGWGTNIANTTLDDVSVTPKNESTAVLYDALGKVAEGDLGGTWLFWNIWNLYAKKMEYTAPAGAIAGRWIGDPCAIDSACGYDGAVCATNYPQGLCTAQCTGDCPKDDNKPPALCVKFKSGGAYCLKHCEAAAALCRSGYKCVNVALANGSSDFVCQPEQNAQATTNSATQ
jgi:hypothetical protein